MPSTSTVRATLWISFPFNLGAACVFAFPSSAPGRLLGLSPSVDPVYVALAVFLVALFGFVYAWLALQPTPDRPLLCVGAIGKSGVFLVAAALWLSDAASGLIVALAAGDLVLASLWFSWLLTGGRRGRAAV